MPTIITEDQIEKSAVALLKTYGNASLDCFTDNAEIEADRSGRRAKSEVLLFDRLEKAARRLNPGIPESAIGEALHLFSDSRLAMTGDALDEVRRAEYRRLSGKDRSFIKGQRYTLLSNRENLTTEGRESLKKLLYANKRLQTAYLLKESFDRLWTYKSEAWMRKFFENWKDSLKWQRLDPYVKFAAMVERNWDGLAAYCRLEDKPSLGFVEGL
ncbi:MAG: transposase, partial [Spirochaetaceae bacterium]|nr:transposase [Spirochaetaceae bacterium]